MAHRVIGTTHSGADFESGEVHRRRGVNQPMPGVEAEPAWEAEERMRPPECAQTLLLVAIREVSTCGADCRAEGAMSACVAG